ncbi:hypothetical protein PLCT2_00178 [Planctomycetaceae bacterium]|nr:hypothetical protein PLCT2_00178 [Planctomycetaceae bacterium]
MPKQIDGPFSELSKSLDRLRGALRIRLPFQTLRAGPATQSERMSFWKNCRAWQQRVAKAYGWKKPNRPRLVKHSVLSTLYQTRHDLIDSGGSRAYKLTEIIGAPPEKLVWEFGIFASRVMGVAPVTTSDLRGAWESVSATLIRGGSAPVRFTPEQMEALTSSNEQWAPIESYLRRRVLETRELGLCLIRWVEEAMKAAGLTRTARLDCDTKIAMALALAKSQPELLGKDIASKIGVSASWLSKQPGWKLWRAVGQRDRTPEVDSP